MMTNQDEAEFRVSRELPRRVSHAIRTPLNVLDGLLQRLDGPVTPEERARLRELGTRASRQLLRIAERLSMFARLEGGGELQNTRCNLADIVRAAVDDVTRTRVRRRVHVDAPRIDGDWSGVADPSLLRFAVAELVDNAVRFARSTVSVTLQRGDTVEVVVANDGPPPRSDDVYRRFAPGDETGLGMGLSMAQQIARAHDGRVHHTIETDSGRTVFALELPWPICR